MLRHLLNASIRITPTGKGETRAKWPELYLPRRIRGRDEQLLRNRQGTKGLENAITGIQRRDIVVQDQYPLPFHGGLVQAGDVTFQQVPSD